MCRKCLNIHRAGPILADNGLTVDYTIIDYLQPLGLSPWYLPPSAASRCLFSLRAQDNIMRCCPGDFAGVRGTGNMYMVQGTDSTPVIV